MKDTPAPEDLPLRALVGWVCKYHFSYDPTAPEVIGALHAMGLLDDVNDGVHRVVEETLEARR